MKLILMKKEKISMKYYTKKKKKYQINHNKEVNSYKLKAKTQIQ